MLTRVELKIVHIDKICTCNLRFVGCFRYEQEINRRNDVENDFVLLKKVWYAVMMAMIDSCFLNVYNTDVCSLK